MLVVLPVCPSDAHLALLNLQLARKLDGPLLATDKIAYDCLVTTDESYDPTEVVTAARDYFRSVSLHRYPVHTQEPRAWPGPQNWAWQESARCVEQKHARTHKCWLWWEADASPLKLAWLSILEGGWRIGNRPFAGSIVEGTHTYMAGVGIYPVDISRHLDRSLRVLTAPFDVVAGVYDNAVSRATRLNHLIHHHVRPANDGDHFDTREDYEKLVLPSAVLFHRCNDGSLARLLLSDFALTKPMPHRQAARTSKAVKALAEGTPMPKTSTCIIQQGGLRALLNTLPAAYAIWQRDGQKVSMVVTEQAAPLLEGVSYAEAVKAPPCSSHVIDLADSEGVLVDAGTFCSDPVTAAGYGGYAGLLPLVFDRRVQERENALLRSALGTGTRDKRPLLLLHLGDMDDMRYLQDDIILRWQHKFRLIELAKLKPLRLFDLLALYDKAAGLIAADSLEMQLARASKVICISPGATPLIHREALHEKLARLSWASDPVRPRLVHVFPDYWPQGNHPEERRFRVARQTWLDAYASHPAWFSCPVHDCQLPRLFDDQTRSLPYWKDIIDFAAAFHDADDILVISNTDTCFGPKLAEAILAGLATHEGGYTHRRDFKRLDAPLGSQAALRRGATYSGVDLFAFTVKWWRAHEAELPGLLAGAEGWWACLKVLADESQFVMWKDAIYHEKHDSRWSKADNRYALPSQMHCLRLACKFMQQHKVDPAKYGLKAV